MDAADDEAAIKTLIEGFAQAIRARDIDAVMAVFAPDVVSFDLGPPLRHRGGEVFADRWRALFDSYAGPIDYDVRELDITAGGDIAFSHSLNHTRGMSRDGRPIDRWLRWTAGYRKRDDRWRIVHEHVSVPADLREGKAVLDLAP